MKTRPATSRILRLAGTGYVSQRPASPPVHRPDGWRSSRLEGDSRAKTSARACIELWKEGKLPHADIFDMKPVVPE